MSVIEKSGVMKYKDKDGQVYIMLPITTADKVDGAVSFYEQELTEEEKAQARANIGAISADEVPESDGSGGASEAIIDVGELPTENIDDKVFYRLIKGTFVYNQYLQTQWTCYCVNELPETGEPAFTGDLTDASSIIVTAYHNLTDGTTNVYLTEDLATQFGMSTGWCPIADVMALTGYAFNDTITDISEDPKDSTFRLLLEYKTYFYDGKWNEVGVQSDYEQHDSAATDYIKNRPFYRESVLLLDKNITVETNDEGANVYASFNWADFEVGHTYEVTFDGKVYECVGKEYYSSTDNLRYVYLGNYMVEPSLLETVDEEELTENNVEDTGEPFLILALGIYTAEPGTYDLKVEDILSFKQLDEIFIPSTIARVSDIPQSDYNQNDSSAMDYVKNRPFYDTNETVFDEDVTTADEDDMGCAIYQSPDAFGANMAEGDNVTVIYNNEEYSLVIMDNNGDEDGAYAGNISIYGIPMLMAVASVYEQTIEEYLAENPSFEKFTVDTGEPFCIAFAAESIGFFTKEPGTYHFTISTGELKQLDEKYIPDTIARVSDIPTGGADIDLTNIPNLYTWKRYSSSPKEYTETEVSNVEVQSTATMGVVNVYYASSISIADGAIVNKDFELLTASDVTKFNVLKGNYVRAGVVTGTSYKYYYIPTDATFTLATESLTVDKAYLIGVNTNIGTFIDYVSSETNDAYPTSGQHTDGNWYEYYKLLGSNGIYIGSGDMPEGYMLQIDPDGDSGLLPDVSTEDNGKILMVVNGRWAAGNVSAALPSAEEASF